MHVSIRQSPTPNNRTEQLALKDPGGVHITKEWARQSTCCTHREDIEWCHNYFPSLRPFASRMRVSTMCLGSCPIYKTYSWDKTLLSPVGTIALELLRAIWALKGLQPPKSSSANVFQRSTCTVVALFRCNHVTTVRRISVGEGETRWFSPIVYWMILLLIYSIYYSLRTARCLTWFSQKRRQLGRD